MTSLVKTLWGPVVVWAAASLLLVIVAMGDGLDPLAADTWVRGDAKHYLSIAERGYEMYPCDASGSDLMCGNAGWFPAYPSLIAAVAGVGFAAPPVAVALSWLFSLATLVLLWLTFLRSLPVGERLAAVVLAAFVPGQIYHRAVFPLSMLAFFALLHLWLLWRGRYVGAGVAGAVAAATYPLGVVLVLIGTVFAAVRGPTAPFAERLRRVAVTGGLAAIGALAVVTAMKLQTGSWTAYFLIQEKYGNGLQISLDIVDRAVGPLFDGPLLDLANVSALQTLAVGLTVLLVVLWAFAKRRDLVDVDWLLLSVTLALWAAPLTQGNLSLYRSEAALVPAAVLLRKLPRPIVVALCAGAVLISIPMAVLFFERRLV